MTDRTQKKPRALRTLLVETVRIRAPDELAGSAPITEKEEAKLEAAEAGWGSASMTARAAGHRHDRALALDPTSPEGRRRPTALEANCPKSGSRRPNHAGARGLVLNFKTIV